MFLSQVASAMHYLHVKHIVHGDLRPTYVYVVSPSKVFILHITRSDYFLPLVLLISAVCKHGLMNAESAWKIAFSLPRFQKSNLKCWLSLTNKYMKENETLLFKGKKGWLKFDIWFLQVKVGRLGRSKPLFMSEYEVTSTSCVVQVAMHPDATRW